MHDYFELHRMSDDLIYKFDKKKYVDGSFAYKRRDQDLWITFKDGIGWCAYDDETKELHGIPWDISLENQSTQYPPEGIWVSRKEHRSYVYELKFNS